MGINGMFFGERIKAKEKGGTGRLKPFGKCNWPKKWRQSPFQHGKSVGEGKATFTGCAAPTARSTAETERACRQRSLQYRHLVPRECQCLRKGFAAVAAPMRREPVGNGMKVNSLETDR